MNTLKRIWGNRLVITILSLVLINLGMVLIGWSVFNIQSQTVTFSSNQSINNMSWATKNPTEHLPILYKEYPEIGDTIGTLSIPALDQKWPIIEGTSDAELKYGVGHFRQSVLPGLNDNSVLSGHRDTVFSEVGKLELKDELIVQTSAGTFTYMISNIRIVDKDDKTVIVPTDHAVLTITTCYPFNFIGSAPKRYILVADLVKKE